MKFPQNRVGLRFFATTQGPTPSDANPACDSQPQEIGQSERNRPNELRLVWHIWGWHTGDFDWGARDHRIHGSLRVSLR